MTSEAALPPCKVCGDPSGGLHYGVLTCRGCKAFFARHLKSEGRFKPCSERCNIRRNRKNACAPCRFRVCLRVGMSKQATKMGRYSLQRKHRMQLELKQFGNHGNEIDKALTSRKELQARLTPDDVLGPGGENLDDIIRTVMDVYAILPSNLHVSQEYLDAKVESYWEMFKLKEGMFGKMPTVSAEEFQDIFNTTGIDIDDRFKFLDVFLDSVRRWVGRLVRFAKGIPGFKQLSFQDQYNLIKYNGQEFWFMGAYRGYSRRMETCIQPNGTVFHWEEFKKAYPGNVIEALFDVSESLKRNELTLEEHIIVQTMSLMFPDRAPLEDRSAVEHLQSVLASCLQRLVGQRPTRQARVRALGHAADMLTTIRRLSFVDECNLSQNTTPPVRVGGVTEDPQALELSVLAQMMIQDVTPDPSKVKGMTFDLGNVKHVYFDPKIYDKNETDVNYVPVAKDVSPDLLVEEVRSDIIGDSVSSDLYVEDVNYNPTDNDVSADLIVNDVNYDAENAGLFQGSNSGPLMCWADSFPNEHFEPLDFEDVVSEHVADGGEMQCASRLTPIGSALLC